MPQPTMAGAEQRKSPTKNKRGVGLSIPVKGGGGILVVGGGILVVGGALIALGAAFLFRRSRANKRRLPPPPSPPPLPNQADEIQGKESNDAAKAKGLDDGGDSMIGLQSILLPIYQESQDLAVATDRSVSLIGQTTVIEDVVEKIEFKEVEEMEEKHDEEEHETLAMESEEEALELSFDEPGSSSIESSVAAVWPADIMEQKEEEESPEMKMKKTAEAEMNCVQEVMKLKANMENFDAMPMSTPTIKMNEKNKPYKGFIMLLALLVAFGLLCCKVAVFPQIL